MKNIYEPLVDLSDIEIKSILEKGDIDDLIRLPLSLGQYYRNWKYAQDKCVELSNHGDALVRANAILGLSYIARTKGILEKHIVKPIILRELRENTKYQWRILDAINDINLYLKWNLGGKALRLLCIERQNS